LLTVVAIGRLPALDAGPRAALVALAVGITAFGVAWLSVRSHDVDLAITKINARPEPVVVSTVGHLGREGGAFYGDKRWLTAITSEDRAAATRALRAAGLGTFVAVEYLPHDFPGAERAGTTTTLHFLSGVDLRLTTWRIRP
jgi:hypothetical protein